MRIASTLRAVPWRAAAVVALAAVVAVLGTGPNRIAGADPVGPIALVTSGHFSPNPADSKLTAFDPYTGAVLYTVPFPQGSQPTCIAVHASWNMAYVCEAYLGGAPGDIAIVDLASRTIVGRIPIGPVPVRAALSADGSRLYVADWGSYTGGPVSGSGGITVIDTATNAIVSKVMMGYAWGVAVSTDGSTIYASKSTAHELWVIDAAQAESCPNTGYFDPNIDAPCPAVLQRLSTWPTLWEPGDLEVSPDGRHLYLGDGTPPAGVYEYDVTVPQNATFVRKYAGSVLGLVAVDSTSRWLFKADGTSVAVYDTTSPSTTPDHTIPMGSDPTYSAGDMALTADGQALVVPNIWQGTVTFVDRSTYPETIVNVVTVGAGTYWGGSWPANVAILEAPCSDTDGDGISDCADVCPQSYGPPPDGCPPPGAPIEVGGVIGLVDGGSEPRSAGASSGGGSAAYPIGLAALTLALAGGVYAQRRRTR